MAQPLNFSAKELNYIQDTDFLLTKREVMQKMRHLMRETEKLISQEIPGFQSFFPEGTLHRAGKISKGENYRGLPYVVLDYPRNFSKDQTFAFRTMFWWGNCFSVTLHLQGEYFERYKPLLLKNFPDLQSAGYYICVHDTPWEYHFGTDNYFPLQACSKPDFKTILEKHAFTKISQKIPLEAWAELPLLASNTFCQLMKCLDGNIRK